MNRQTWLFFAAVTGAFFLINYFFAPTPSHSQVEEKRVEVTSPTVSEAAPLEQVKASLNSQKDSSEAFYVLENEFQQLVFSTHGGALAEINLPFESPTHPSSVVKEIEFDRRLQEEQPANDLFPASEYYLPSSDSSSEGPKLQTERSLGGYYPLLRRSIQDAEGEVIKRVAPEYYATTILSRQGDLSHLVFQVTEFDANHITFQASEGYRTITKTYSFPKDSDKSPYVVDLAIRVDGDRDLMRGLWLGSGVTDIELMSGRPAPALKAQISRKGKGEIEKVSLPKPSQPISVGSIHPNWISNANGFFGIIIDPLDEIGAGYRAEQVSGESVPSRVDLIPSAYDSKGRGVSGYRLSLPLNQSGGTMHFRLYAGPYDGPILKQVDATYTIQGTDPNYLSARSSHGIFRIISEPFSKFLMIIMSFFHSITGSWGFSIILLTVVLRLLLYPLSAWSMKAMRRMQKIAPEVAAIQKKYKSNPKQAQLQILNLYREKKANPFLGCFPLLIQMPFLVGMFDLLKSTFALRGATFIPGWINNLAAPDVLFSWSYPIIFFGTSFHLLPILLGLVMLLQQRFTSALPKDRSLWTEQQRQQRVMGNVMVVVFAVMFYNFPSGLNLYWLSSMLLGILQQWIINKQLDRKGDKKEPPPQKIKSSKHRTVISIR